LLAELRHADGARYGCFEKEESILGSDDAGKVAEEYQRSRGLATVAEARSFLARLIDYSLRPNRDRFDELRGALTSGGATAAAAEDLCRCVYFSGAEKRQDLLASVSPPATGLFWAARVLHEAHRTEEAVGLYRGALEGDPTSPRTRLLYAIALIDELRASEALAVLAEVPPAWAPEPVAYWRARASLELGDATTARRLLEPLPAAWKGAPTVPDAWIGSGPVQPSSPPACLLGRAVGEGGDEAAARTLLEQNKDCRADLGRLELRQGRPFEALLDFEQFGNQEPLLLEALGQLRACEWARRDLRRWEASCRDEERPEGCAVLRKIGPELVAACPEPPEPAAAASDAALEARLKTPRLVPFEERPVPVGRRWLGKRPEAEPKAPGYPALADFTIVALSPAAPRMFAVSVSQDVDPRAEVSAGGYWLHLSANHGQTWEGPYYLGFADQFPYVVLPVTHLPPFDGNRVNLEVERREVDESTITFPPVGLRAKKVQKNLYLSVDLAAVGRDSDGDGLTDLLEEKLGLDPFSADTDGDGIPDASDPLPLQPLSPAESSDRGQVLEAVLPYLFGGPAPIQQTAAVGPAGSAMRPEPRPFASARTLFVSGEDLILPHAAGIRAVGLTPASLEAYRRKFGATYPMTMPDVAFDQARQRVFVRYDFGWRGGSFLAERRDGRWTITPRGSWIS
jgi:tetratricopeptide (TPR) repeat protein